MNRGVVFPLAGGTAMFTASIIEQSAPYLVIGVFLLTMALLLSGGK